MDYVFRTGCITDDLWEYTQKESECPAGKVSRQKDAQPESAGVSSASFGQLSEQDRSFGGSEFGMSGWRRLPENQLEPVLMALYENGPVVVSIHAGNEWNLYAKGILNSCKQDTVIDHAVMLLGWGHQDEHKYWQLQNSWGKDWGEMGFIRIERHDHEEEKNFCGIDNEPLIGSGCTGGPPTVRVCGHCGILNDVVQPHFSLSEKGWWRREGGRKPTEAQLVLQQAAQPTLVHSKRHLRAKHSS
jgi:hypothetical protein